MLCREIIIAITLDLSLHFTYINTVLDVIPLNTLTLFNVNAVMDMNIVVCSKTNCVMCNLL